MLKPTRAHQRDLETRISFATKYIDNVKGLKTSHATDFWTSLKDILEKTITIHEGELNSILDIPQIGETTDVTYARVQSVRGSIKALKEVIEEVSKADERIHIASQKKAEFQKSLEEIKATVDALEPEEGVHV